MEISSQPKGILLQSFIIIHQDLYFGDFALKIELVAFVYELFNYKIIFSL